MEEIRIRRTKTYRTLRRMIQSPIVFVLLAMSMISCANNDNISSPEIVQGVLDLRQWDPIKNGTVALRGEWQFYVDRFIRPDEKITSSISPSYIYSPGSWKDYIVQGRKLSPYGFGTYRIRILLPDRDASQNEPLALRTYGFNSAHALYVNGKLREKAGNPGRNRKDTTPGSKRGVFILNTADNTLDLRIHVANFHDREGGFRNSPRIGLAKTLINERERRIHFDMLLFGAMLIMGLFQLITYAVLRRNRSPLFFGLMCLFLAFRSLTLDEILLLNFFADFPYELLLKIDYGFYFLVIPTAAYFIHHLYREEFLSGVARLIALLFLPAAALVVITPARIYTQILPLIQTLTILCLCYALYSIILAIFRKRESSILFLIGFLPAFIATINDILYKLRIIDTGHYAPAGLFFLILAQSAFIARRFSAANQKAKELYNIMEKRNTAMNRFVPHEFLNILGKDNIADVRLGDQTRAEMTIMFANIRSYMSLSETMTPEENFQLLNRYLHRVVPIIRLHNGFVNQYYGEGILALFPGTPDQAIAAAVSMQKKVSQYNRVRKKRGRHPIPVGIGLHTGSLMLGIIGEEFRMGNGIVSDAVNLASRIEDLTRIFGAAILLSSSVLKRLNHPERFSHRLIAAVQVKGRLDTVSIAEILQDKEEPTTLLKLETRDEFEKGVHLFQSRQYDAAGEYFERVVKINPEDRAALLYSGRSAFYAEHGAPPGPSGLGMQDTEQA